jgi:hypothetical protein
MAYKENYFLYMRLVQVLIHARFKIFLDHALISDPTLVCSFVDLQVMWNHDNFVDW